MLVDVPKSAVVQQFITHILFFIIVLKNLRGNTLRIVVEMDWGLKMLRSIILLLLCDFRHSSLFNVTIFIVIDVVNF